MGKKSFRSGLGSLIQNSNIEFENNSVVKEKSSEEKLKQKLNQLQEELKLWRTGKLTLGNFKKTLKDNNLKYNVATNGFEKISK
ncbi:MAG: hypothetical protein P1P88_17020 [Bacteroidales bacterium]|nr:hypothetical protein [Bacteroidales bacterium]